MWGKLSHILIGDKSPLVDLTFQNGWRAKEKKEEFSRLEEALEDKEEDERSGSGEMKECGINFDIYCVVTHILVDMYDDLLCLLIYNVVLFT